MATTSEVDAGLDSAAAFIKGSRKAGTDAANSILSGRNQLQNLPAALSDVISTVQGFAPNGRWEELSQDKLLKLTAEFKELKATMESNLVAIGKVEASAYAGLPGSEKTALITKLTAIGTLVSAAITTLGG